jgi:CRP-like cAMP-binding protein
MQTATKTTISPVKNHLLQALVPEVQERIFPFIELVELKLGQVIYEPGDKLDYVYFPINCIVSLLYIMKSGASAAISMVGNDGVVGVALFMGGEYTSNQYLVTSAGYAYRFKAKKLTEEFNLHGQLLEIMLLYTQSLIAQMSQTAVCNRYHTINQQLCRLLLLTLDRLPDNHITLTQELIANMLGVRREGVTEAAGKLQKLGVIHYHRGHIIVLNRTKLENLSCECYAVVKKETDRLLPNLIPKEQIKILHASPSKLYLRPNDITLNY